MSRLIQLAHDMHQFVPTSDHDYVPAFSETEQVDALTELLEAYPTATQEEKKAIESGFYHLMDMQPYSVSMALLDLVKMYKLMYDFIPRTIKQLEPNTEFKKKLKK